MGPLEAARQAIANPLLNLSIKGAEGVLFSVKGGQELTLGGVNAAGQLISKSVKKNASIYFGMSVDRELEDKVKLTLIATGLKQEALESLTGRVRNFVPLLRSKKEAFTASKRQKRLKDLKEW